MNAARLIAGLGFLALACAGGIAVRTVELTSEPPALPQDFKDLNPGYDGRFQFVRIQFTPESRGGFGFGRGRGGREPAWAHDYPRAERNFMSIIGETTFVDPVVDASNILRTDDPDLFKYPVAYIVEVGLWNPSDEEAEGLGQYLQKGGFLIVDDFRGNWDLANFEFHMNRAIPGATLVQLDKTHEIFDSFFRVDPYALEPPYGAQFPTYYGIYEDNDRDKRLLAIVNYDNDIAEYWEYSDWGRYPVEYANEAYKLGVNYIIYALTH